jgi:hypothetical protein
MDIRDSQENSQSSHNSRLEQKTQIDTKQFLLFENDQKKDLKNALFNVSELAKSPYDVLERWITYQLMEHAAMFQILANKNTIDKVKNHKVDNIAKMVKDLRKLEAKEETPGR